MARRNTPEAIIRSVRCRKSVWIKAKARAEREGVLMNTLLNEILEGYAENHIDMPRTVKQYTQTRP